MKSLKKLALATAIAAAPLTVNALEALDDDFLGDVTGQEGITIDKHYQNTIEEFKYVDGDGAGDGTGAGSVSLTGIKIGEFSSATTPGMGALTGFTEGLTLDATNLQNVWERGQTIDAAANGVLITSAMIGEESNAITNQLQLNDGSGTLNGQPVPGGAQAVPTMVVDGWNQVLQGNWTPQQFNNFLSNAGASLMPTDASGNIQLDHDGDPLTPMVTLMAEDGVTPIKLRGTYGNGKDIEIGGIELGYAGATGGDTNSIGTLHVLNVNNFVSMTRLGNISRFMGRFSSSTPAGQASFIDLVQKNAEQWIQPQTRISSKTSGTGVVITAEGDGGAQAVVYTDTDGGAGNQVGVLSMANFRLVTDNSLDAANANDLANGTYLRGSKTVTTIDVEDGKLKLHQVKDGNTILGKIFVGDATQAMSVLTGEGSYADGGKGVLGGIAILGNHYEGTTYISGH